jgi:catechol 2,3-dioxygenase-like lactoylglutathione lyase family enzyme
VSIQVERVVVSFLTRDIGRAKAFYAGVLGLAIRTENALMLHRRYAPFDDGRRP